TRHPSPQTHVRRSPHIRCRTGGRGMFTEEQLENVVIEYFDELDYQYLHAQKLQRDEREVILLDRLEKALVKLNQGIPLEVIRQAIREIKHFDTNDLFANNKVFHKKLTEAIEIPEYADGETIFHRVHLIDWDNPDNNDFLVVNQLEVMEQD